MATTSKIKRSSNPDLVDSNRYIQQAMSELAFQSQQQTINANRALRASNYEQAELILDRQLNDDEIMLKSVSGPSRLPLGAERRYADFENKMYKFDPDEKDKVTQLTRALAQMGVQYTIDTDAAGNITVKSTNRYFTNVVPGKVVSSVAAAPVASAAAPVASAAAPAPSAPAPAPSVPAPVSKTPRTPASPIDLTMTRTPSSPIDLTMSSTTTYTPITPRRLDLVPEDGGSDSDPLNRTLEYTGPSSLNNTREYITIEDDEKEEVNDDSVVIFNEVLNRFDLKESSYKSSLYNLRKERLQQIAEYLNLYITENESRDSILTEVRNELQKLEKNKNKQIEEISRALKTRSEDRAKGNNSNIQLTKKEERYFQDLNSKLTQLQPEITTVEQNIENYQEWLQRNPDDPRSQQVKESLLQFQEQLIQLTQEYESIEAEYKQLEKNIYGYGLPTKQIPNGYKFGKYKLLKKKLDKNVLKFVTKNDNRSNIPEFYVSNKLVDIIKKAINTGAIYTSDTNKLTNDEKDILETIVTRSKADVKLIEGDDDKSIGGLMKKSLSTRNPAYATDDKLRSRLQILIGEREGGNDSKQLLNELSDVLDEMERRGLLNSKKANKITKEVMKIKV